MGFFNRREPPREEKPAETPRPSAPVPVTPAPPAPPPSAQPVGFETVLGANSVMEGTLKSSANVRLDGAFTGNLDISGNVLVGESAKINADIHARNISIAGAVRGNVSGKKVQILRTGRIWGDIHAQALTTEEGAFIDGKIKMVGAEQPVEAVMESPETPTEPTPPSRGDDTVKLPPVDAPPIPAALLEDKHD